MRASTSAKLDEQDIDAFVGELRSSGAHKGVLYSLSGYTEPAIAKAKKLAISCCRLYRNQPPDLPDALVFRSYCSKPAARIGLVGGLNPASSLKTWNDLFGLEPDGPSGKLSVLDILAESYHKGETLACQSITSDNLFPRDWQSQIDIRDPEKPENSVTVLVEGIWRIYQGELSAHLLRGSYSIIDQEFLGQQSGPCIDLWGPPGAHWTLLEERPQWTGSSILNCILRRGKFKEALVQHYGLRLLMPSP